MIRVKRGMKDEGDEETEVGESEVNAGEGKERQ